MPRVSQEHRDARREQILDAACRCFVRNGFHSTSMQDVFTEAGLSAGAVYRYFGSKAEIIGAIAQTRISDVTAALDDIEGPDLPPLDEVLGSIFATIEDLDETDDIAKLIGQVWGEAIRSPDVGRTLRGNVAGVLARFTRLAGLYQEHGVLRPDVPAEQIARALGALVQGFMLQRSLFADVDATDFRAGVSGLLGGYVGS